MKKVICISAIVIWSFASCEKITYYPDKPVPFISTESIAHRGGGCDTLRDNNYLSCITALAVTDGIEVDIQLSKNRTVWLSHSSIVEGCEGERKCFAETYDLEIQSINTCNGKYINYTKLEDVMKYMDQNNIKKYISIDLKGWTPCSGNSLDIEGEMRAEVEQVIKLGEQYHLAPYLLIETDFKSVLIWAKAKNSSIKTYYTSFGDYEKGMLVALDNGFDGISYKSHFMDEIDADKMHLLHKKGLRLMAWNIPDKAYADYLKSVNVDILQIDL